MKLCNNEIMNCINTLLFTCKGFVFTVNTDSTSKNECGSRKQKYKVLG